MAQSSSDAGKGQRKGKNVHLGFASPPTPSTGNSASSVGNLDAISAYNAAIARKLTQEVKIPTFADSNPLEEASSSPAYAGIGLDVEEEEGGEGSNNGDDLDGYGYGKEEDLDD